MTHTQEKGSRVRLSKQIIALYVVEMLVATAFVGVFGFVGDEASAEEEYDMGNVVAMWKFDENGGDTVYDETDNDNDGTINGATWTGGKNGSGLSFDEDYIDFGDIDIPATGTIELWFKPKIDYDGSQGTGKLWYKYHCIDVDFKENGSIRVGLWPSSDSWAFSDERTYYKDVWYHIAWLWGEGGGHLYINGSKEDSNSYIETAEDSSEAFMIGATHSDEQHFHGTIDEVVIHNKALEPSEFYGMKFMPDLKVEESGIEFSAGPAVGEPVLVNVTVENVGSDSFGRWVTLPSMPTTRGSMPAIIHDDEIYVMGGNIDDGGFTNVT